MKIKRLGENARGVIALGYLPNKARSPIYMVAENQDGLGWYETKDTYSASTVAKYVSAGQYSVCFRYGITKSTMTDWL